MNTRSPIHWTIGIVLISVPLIVVSCVSKQHAKTDGRGQVVSHAVYGERLKTIMGELKRLAYDRLPQEYDSQRDRQTLLARAAEYSQDLADVTRQTSEMIPELDATPEDRALFAKLARQLANDARYFNQLASRMDTDNLPSALDKMRQTCNECHAKLRGY